MDLPKTKKRRSTRLLLKQKNRVAEDEPKTSFGCLPLEIIKDILSRLPNVESILQSMSVCQSWELCARDPCIFQLHFSRSSVTGSQLLYLYSSFKNELHSVDFSYMNEKGFIVNRIGNAFSDLTPRSFSVLGSSNGIMLLQDPFHKKWNCIYNPVTRDYKLVPKLDCQYSWYCSYGVGGHPVTNDYKTFHILIAPDWDYSRPKAYVYSLSTNEWTPLGELPYKIDRFCNQGVLVHGRLHWLTARNKRKSNPFPNIISIDFMDYSVKEVPMPTDVIFKKSKRSQLVVLGGCLLVGVRRIDSRMHIWVMKTYGMESSWVKQYVFGSEFLKFDRNWRSRGEESLQIVCLLNNEEILLRYDGLCEKTLASYNFVTKSCKILTFGGTYPTSPFRIRFDSCWLA